MKFYLLDVDSRFRGGKAEIRLWGVTDKGERAVLFDGSFRQYFYLVTEKPSLIEQALKNVPGVEDYEFKQVRLFGKPVKAFKIYVSNPDTLEPVVKAVSKLEGFGGVYEDDLRYSQHYLLDRDVRPCGWHVAEGDEVDRGGLKVDKAYSVSVPPKTIDDCGRVAFRVLAFYMIPLPSKGSPKPERDKVACLAIRTNDGFKEVLDSEKLGEKGLLRKFIEAIDRFDPDIIVGYGTNRRDWEYLIKRAEVNGLTLRVGRDGSEPHRSLYGHISIAGRIALDLYDYAEDIQDIKIKTLENLASYMGVEAKVEPLEEPDIAAMWTTLEGRQRVLEFADDRCRLVMEAFEEFIEYGCQLSNLVCIPLDHVCTAAVGFRVESYLMKWSRLFGELVPKRVEKPYRPYAGAIVLTPKPGLHENIAVLDFRSMYPNIMVKYNVSPDTYVEPGVKVDPGDVYVSPEVGHRFLKKPDGFYREALKMLLKTRAEVRQRLKGLNPESAEYRVLNARQEAIKVITNAIYGYAGWIGARWYRQPIAEATTAWGRETLRKTIEYARKIGLEIIYGDTDSIFVRYDEDKVGKLIRYVAEHEGLEIKPDAMYSRILFTEAKKRYAGILTDGRIDIVGLEAVRGDWCEAARRAQREVVKIILETGSPEEAVKRARDIIAEVKAGKIPLRELIIWKAITRPLEEYKVKTPHVEAAKRLTEMGWEVGLGDKVGFVIVKGVSKLYDRVMPYQFVKKEDVDYYYYVENQVIPAVLRVLGVFGYDRDSLEALKRRGQMKLF